MMMVMIAGRNAEASHGARPVHQTISMIKWIRTIRLSMTNSLSGRNAEAESGRHHRTSGPSSSSLLPSLELSDTKVYEP